MILEHVLTETGHPRGHTSKVPIMPSRCRLSGVRYRVSLKYLWADWYSGFKA